MIRRVDEPVNAYLAFEAAGTVSASDVREFQAELRRSATAESPVRVLMDVVAMDGADFTAIWQDMKHVTEYTQLVERIAVVGDARWERWLTTASSMLPGLDARYFEADQRSQAALWLNG